MLFNIMVTTIHKAPSTFSVIKKLQISKLIRNHLFLLVSTRQKKKNCLVLLVGIETEFLKTALRRSPCGAAEMNPTSNHEVAGSIPGLAQ